METQHAIQQSRTETTQRFNKNGQCMGQDQTRESGELSGGLCQNQMIQGPFIYCLAVTTTEYLTSLEQEMDSMTKM